MKNTLIAILLILAFLIVGYLGFKFKNPTIPIDNRHIIDSLQYKIDSLELEKSSINIDTIYIQIAENQKEYEKDINTIITNTPSEDLDFFTNYIGNNKARFDSICISTGY